MASGIGWIGLLAAMVAGLSVTGWSQEKPVVIYTKDNAPVAPKLEDLPLKASLSQYGMTWTFAQPAHVGQFVNGDWYVVGPVTVVAIDPKPLYGAEIPADQKDPMDNRQVANRVRNGFMLNPPAAQKVSYDSAIRNYFVPSLVQKLPVSMKPGDSLVTTISMRMGESADAPLENVAHSLKRTGAGQYVDSSPVKDSAVLSCVAEPLPADAFRPAFADRGQKIYLARDLKRDLLPALAAPGDAPKLEQYVRWTQRPWVQIGQFSFDNPVDNMPSYGREYGRVVGIAGLLLCSNFTPEQKEPLLDNFVQVGIDLGGLIRAGHPGWEAWGGFGTGRKFPIVFAGLLLGDDALANINKTCPQAHFGEDEQTAYGDCWTGAKVVFTGHRGIDEVTGAGRQGTGPYEDRDPSTWNGLAAGAARNGDKTSEGYRRTSTTCGWIGEALVIRLLHGEKAWDHDAFFDYVDRWMYEVDTPAVLQKLKEATGQDYNKNWCRQGQSWDKFVNEMWAKYRTGPSMPPTDGWKQQHDESYYLAAIEKEKQAGGGRDR